MVEDNSASAEIEMLLHRAGLYEGLRWVLNKEENNGI
jgi:hypothetical protein